LLSDVVHETHTFVLRRFGGRQHGRLRKWRRSARRTCARAGFAADATAGTGANSNTHAHTDTHTAAGERNGVSHTLGACA
jgi:hypothetical protein